MLPVYQQLARRVGTRLAHELAQDLVRWHDEMVRHERRLTSQGGGARCEADDCPHAAARELWRQAVQVFGTDAEGLGYLRATSGATTRADTG